MNGEASDGPALSALYDVVVVGAGPAGSSMAAWLAGRGWRVLLLERDRLPRHKVCGEFLSPEAQKSLQTQGLYEAIAALGPRPLNGAKLIGQSGSMLELKMPGTAWGLSRYQLDAALASAAEQRGAQVWCGTTVTGWQETDGERVVQLRTRPEAAHNKPDQSENSTVRTRALVVACGRHGFDRSVAKQRRPPLAKAAGEASVGIKCHFTQLAMPAQVELYLFDGGYVGINGVENGHANVCALASYSAFARAGRSPSALIAAAAQWNPAFGERLRGALALPETECAVAPVDTRRPAYPWNGLPLLGDTAAMIAPLVGDGMAMALRSAELCGPLVDSYLQGMLLLAGIGKRVIAASGITNSTSACASVACSRRCCKGGVAPLSSLG